MENQIEYTSNFAKSVPKQRVSSEKGHILPSWKEADFSVPIPTIFKKPRILNADWITLAFRMRNKK